MNFFKSHFNEKLLDNFDVDLQTFYSRVLSKELDSSNSANAVKVKMAMKKVVNAYAKQTVETFSSSILFDSLEKRFAYVLKHCPCFTSAVARHFYQLLQSNPQVLDGAIQGRRINLCCLGGGPATDAVAVAKVVNSLNNCFVNGYSGELEFRISVVDLSEDWRSTAKKVVKTLKETPEFCDQERMRLSFEFLEADLSEMWTDEVRGVLGRADIVTMVYFVSAVNGSKAMKNCCSMLQKVFGVLKPGALLFFLDSSKGMHYESICSAACPLENLEQVYGPHLEEFHTLSMKSIKRFTELYPTQFNVDMCLTNCFVSCAGWIKKSSSGSTTSVDQQTDLVRKKQTLLPANYNVGTNSLRKMETFNTKKQERFRRKIEMLFLSGLNFAVEDLEDGEDFEIDARVCVNKILYPTKSKRKRIVTWPGDEALWTE